MAPNQNKRHSFSLSPATKASRRVLGQRNTDPRRSFDSQATASTLGDMPAVEVEHYLVAPAFRWTTANRI